MKKNIKTKFKHLKVDNGSKSWDLVLPFNEKFWYNETVLKEKCFKPLIKKNKDTIVLITKIPKTLQRYRATITLL
jgi:hypothetical protein